MKFEEVYEWQTQGRLSTLEAAQMLNMSERNLARYILRYQEEGIDGLNDKRLGKAAHNAAPVDEVIALCEIYQNHYRGYSAAHFFDKYRYQHQGIRSYNWVRRTLQHRGLLLPQRKKGQHRRRRERKPMIGMMIHQDASTHEWVEGKMWDLVVTMDDASSEIYSAFFVDEEGTWSSFLGVKDMIEANGLCCSFYSDRAKHYWNMLKAGGKVDKQQLTQFGRAMKQLGIEMIPAYSPEARGRSERVFGTLQARLPKELTSAGITSQNDANRFLRDSFLPEFNQTFSVKPQEEESAFVPWKTNYIKLDDILCLQEQRTVNKDNTVSYKGQCWQISRDKERYSYARSKVMIHEYIDGSIGIFHGPREIAKFEAREARSQKGESVINEKLYAAMVLKQKI